MHIYIHTLQHTALRSSDVTKHFDWHAMYTYIHTATHCTTLQWRYETCWWARYAATHCNTQNRTATHCNMLQWRYKTCCLAHCNTTTHCKTLKQIATYYNKLQWRYETPCQAHCNTFQLTELHRNTLHMLQWRATCCQAHCNTATHCNTLKHIAIHWNKLQHTAIRCSDSGRHVAGHTATNCDTLTHTATHCKTLQWRYETCCRAPTTSTSTPTTRKRVLSSGFLCGSLFMSKGFF